MPLDPLSLVEKVLPSTTDSLYKCFLQGRIHNTLGGEYIIQNVIFKIYVKWQRNVKNYKNRKRLSEMDLQILGISSCKYKLIHRLRLEMNVTKVLSIFH